MFIPSAKDVIVCKMHEPSKAFKHAIPQASSWHRYRVCTSLNAPWKRTKYQKISISQANVNNHVASERPAAVLQPMWAPRRGRAIESILTGRNEFHGMSEWWIQTVFLSQELWKVLRVFHFDLLQSSLDSTAASGFWRAFTNILCCAKDESLGRFVGGGCYSNLFVLQRSRSHNSCWWTWCLSFLLNLCESSRPGWTKEEWRSYIWAWRGASGGGAVTSLPVCSRRFKIYEKKID